MLRLIEDAYKLSVCRVVIVFKLALIIFYFTSPFCFSILVQFL